jgi:hypothetical protein
MIPTSVLLEDGVWTHPVGPPRFRVCHACLGADLQADVAAEEPRALLLAEVRDAPRNSMVV